MLAASLFIVSAVRCSEEAIRVIRHDFSHKNASVRVAGLLRYHALWRSRFHVWLKMEDGAQLVFKVSKERFCWEPVLVKYHLIYSTTAGASFGKCVYWTIWWNKLFVIIVHRWINTNYTDWTGKVSHNSWTLIIHVRNPLGATAGHWFHAAISTNRSESDRSGGPSLDAPCENKSGRAEPEGGGTSYGLLMHNFVVAVEDAYTEGMENYRTVRLKCWP